MSLPSVYQIAFSMVKGVSPDIANDMLSVFGSEENFFKADELELQKLSGMPSKIFANSYRRGLLEAAKRESDYIAEKGINACYFTDDDYPARFLSTPDVPLLVYTSGRCDLNAKKVISMVGTRHATAYGLGMCREIVAALWQKVGDDVVIVSGLAYGIDVASHKAALDAGLPTIAVMAHGLDMIYPAQHRSVAVEIVRNGGAILTEYPSGTRIHRSNFLSRNRLIAALSDCTLVVESAEKGGALVTANIASNYGRDVFALPGRVGDEYSAGCNSLIRKNVAALATSVDDIAYMMQWDAVEPPVAVQQELFVELSPEEKKVYDSLKGRDIVHISGLVRDLKQPVHNILTILVDLEFRGLVQVLPGNRYCLSRKI